MWIYGNKKPNQSSKNEKDIGRSQEIISQSGLKRCKSQVENDIHNKRQEYDKRYPDFEKQKAGISE
jgi:hypothetical protein